MARIVHATFDSHGVGHPVRVVADVLRARGHEAVLFTGGRHP